MHIPLERGPGTCAFTSIAEDSAAGGSLTPIFMKDCHIGQEILEKYWEMGQSAEREPALCQHP